MAYRLSLGGFRGGPAFGALFLGAAAGVIASRLPGFQLTPAIAVGMAAAFASVLALPLSAVVLATLLVSKAGYGAEPLIIVAVVVSYIVTLHIGNGSKPALRPRQQPRARRRGRPGRCSAIRVQSGIHQLASPNSFISAGTSRARMTVPDDSSASSATPPARPRRRHEVVGVVDEDEKLLDPGQLQHPLDRVGAAHHGEVVAVAAGELVLPDELVQPGDVHERQAAQVQHDVAHAVGF